MKRFGFRFPYVQIIKGEGMDIQKLIEDETPLFTAHRWRAYRVTHNAPQSGETILLLAFNGQLGYEREDFRGWQHKHTVSSLSEAIETLIDVYIGLRP